MTDWIPNIDSIDDIFKPFSGSENLPPSIEHSIYSILSADTLITAAVSTRIYPSIIPQNAAMPCITYQQISGVREQLLSGADGLVEARFQINCWSPTYGGARLLADYTRQALAGYQGEEDGCYIQDIQLADENDMPQYDTEKEIISRYGKRLDFTIWFEET
jgi:hypothetical protein